MFAVEFLAHGVRGFNDVGVFVTFEETPTDIRRNAASLGLPIERWEAEGRWAFVDASADIEESSTVGSYDFNALVARVEHVVHQIGARRVSLDFFGAIFTRFSDIGIVRHELFRIASCLEALGVTSVLTAERAAEHDGVSWYGVEEFVLNNVIILRNVLRQERRRRTVEIVKFRGASHRRLRRSVAEFAPARLVIDTLSALERVATPRALLDFLISLGAVLRLREITALLTSAAGVHLTPALAPSVAVEIASLADVTILLRGFEHAAEIQRAIAVAQARGTAHEQSIRQVTIDGAGMHIGERLRGVSHILAADPLVEDPQWTTAPGRAQGPRTDE
ncbi:ATPase domain-containing protein [Saccharopolyspora shandongensis]|uniref:ATPase domain-containing protein n=1 Tax=Saccharopolyspora shandongensis TaxID=418495 RepID=UPI0033DD45E5